ncbi:sugar-binding transcriptional regulator [Mesorhizobium sp. 1B3]|uniref:sugar-binding transcriptional regulator n=1 Tax=Mesorhizobium sp. 1B3 TaxID=3243599 RepID=UPI003D958877
MSEASQPQSVRLPSDEQREHLMVRVAKLFYDLERTQSEIAAELGLTRWQVKRLLTEARELGVVRIEITPRTRRRTNLEVMLQQAYGLHDAIVVPNGVAADNALLIEAVAQAAANYLVGINPKPDLLGVSWGRTMTAVARRLPANWSPGLHVVLLNGAINLRSTASQTSAVAEEIAKSANGIATLLPVPAIVGKSTTRQALEEDPIVERVLDLAQQAEVVCFSMGPISNDSVLFGSGYLEESDLDRLKAAGAVGDILGRFVDARGQIVDAVLDDRTVGLRIEHLKSKRCSIGVVAGADKTRIALAALRGRYVSVLITDETIARFALEISDGE